MEVYEVLVSVFIERALAMLFLVNCCSRQAGMNKVEPKRSRLLNF